MFNTNFYRVPKTKKTQKKINKPNQQMSKRKIVTKSQKPQISVDIIWIHRYPWKKCPSKFMILLYVCPPSTYQNQTFFAPYFIFLNLSYYLLFYRHHHTISMEMLKIKWQLRNIFLLFFDFHSSQIKHFWKWDQKYEEIFHQ